MKAPGSWIVKTIIGIPLSRARAKAAVSMTFEPLADRLVEGEPVVARRVRVALGVGGIDAVDLVPLNSASRVHLGGTQRRAGVGGEERVADAAGEEHDLAGS